ncbi:5-methyltetrahydropteroyltriglutamate--homocysteine methyltransferase [Halocatena pleomorpha]|uniref:5-methyltetrahydropteroyltriglutamate--homocysteine methyltransferase n=1 Tax=Halocatena pleomorpha TaxID=1785090 RepID=A0A3P3RJE0_9EURY|nr:5-methyltetrahydropteroyltriglutamate--homocysteine methyltransferase [Halocatena pleomorpha]RRJ33444.1 5-methyltetrahydropteroyltriglutamate--homocysteine methyltransferase [Halocatena pleomorpha]
MVNVVASTPGLFPLPDPAKTELSDLKGHQKSDLVDGEEGTDVSAVYDRVRTELVERQQAAGLDRIVEGQARWDDMLAHPLTVHDNVETGGIVRYYDNNNFYREPVVTGELTESGDMAADLASVGDVDGLQAVVPGPYSLSKLSSDEYYRDEAEFLGALAEFLAGEIESFPSVETLFVLEPSLVETPPGDGQDAAASEAIDTVADAIDTDVVVQTYFGALPEKVHAHLLDADIDAVGYDFVTDHEESLYNINEYGTKDDIALGVVDGQNTRVETVGTIRERIEWVQESTPGADFETVYATPNTGLFYLPVNRFEEKLDALGEAATTEEVHA